MTIRVADGAITTLDGAEILTGPDPIWARPFQAVAIADGLATVTLPALSVAAVTFRLQNQLKMRAFGNCFGCLTRPGMKCQGYTKAPGEPGFNPINRALFYSPAMKSPDERWW